MIGVTVKISGFTIFMLARGIRAQCVIRRYITADDNELTATSIFLTFFKISIPHNFNETTTRFTRASLHLHASLKIL